jgi:hypothetical protein
MSAKGNAMKLPAASRRGISEELILNFAVSSGGLTPKRLEMIFKSPIKNQIKSAKKNGEISSRVGPGLFAILELAKLRGIIRVC